MTTRSVAIAVLIAVLALGLTERTLGPVRTVVGAVVQPISRPFVGLAQSVRSIGVAVQQIKDLRNRNAQLVTDNTALTAQVAELTSLKSENDALRQALNFETAHRDQSLIASQVIGRSPTSFLDSFTIDKGSDDSVQLRAPVIANGYLVGIVQRVSSRTASVQLITSSNSLVPVVFASSRAQGLLQGGLNGLTVTQVSADAHVANAEPAVTSALGSAVPADLPVGTATTADHNPSSIVQSIHLQSPLHFNQLELVFVGQPVPENQ